MFSSILPDANKYAPHERALRAWDEKGGDGDAAVAEAIFARFRGQVDADVQAVRQRVFEAGLVSRAAEAAACRWIAAQHRRLARGASRVASAFARAAPTGDGTLRMLLLTLNYQGESTKSPFMQARFHAGLNATMVQALATGRWKESATLEIDGVKVHCCASSLFFRAALLARFAGGGLSVRQMEIFDAWLWIWSTHLHGSLEPPGEGAWRVDLDSSEGLQARDPYGRGRRPLSCAGSVGDRAPFHRRGVPPGPRGTRERQRLALRDRRIRDGARCTRGDIPALPGCLADARTAARSEPAGRVARRARRSDAQRDSRPSPNSPGAW